MPAIQLILATDINASIRQISSGTKCSLTIQSSVLDGAREKEWLARQQVVHEAVHKPCRILEPSFGILLAACTMPPKLRGTSVDAAAALCRRLRRVVRRIGRRAVGQPQHEPEAPLPAGVLPPTRGAPAACPCLVRIPAAQPFVLLIHQRGRKAPVLPQEGCPGAGEEAHVELIRVGAPQHRGLRPGEHRVAAMKVLAGQLGDHREAFGAARLLSLPSHCGTGNPPRVPEVPSDPAREALQVGPACCGQRHRQRPRGRQRRCRRGTGPEASSRGPGGRR
mmetsp:Transcript_147471/g.471558  ORF Transcript_147471/g.471558 Transcript_147471/m.471558 type:complete len:279 (+) Transcript_147471:305-1141(+)